MWQKFLLFVAGTALGLGLVVGGIFVYQQFVAAPPLRGFALSDITPVENFTLTDGEGHAVQLADYRGKIVALYYGYTFCPDVCPTTMSDLKQAVEALGPQAAEVQVLFITIDPERDTPARASQYARGFNPAFIGLSGTPEEIAEAAAPLGIFYARQDVPDSAAGYLMQHSSIVNVVDRDGNLRVIWPFGTRPEDMESDFRALLR
jgi:protein SCO1/2